ncbi:MAG: hypothetical protein AAF611_01205 [Bacteroidota bacterium]
MKSVLKHSKIGAMIFIVMLLFQSCTIYMKAPSTLEQAVESKRRAKVYLKSGAKVSYKRIIQQGDNYYGIIKKDTLQINPSTIKLIRLKNRTFSIIATVVVTGVGVLSLMVGTILVGLSV